uniref:BZIP domain-containing protein n=1 Tax=Meloidogyne javanica TaxID=6303 RepID=A0A915MEH2_MELJA
MEVNQQQPEGKITTRSQLYELTPPMDPSNDNNNSDRTFRGKNNTKHPNSTTTSSPPTPPILFNRPRPTDLPGISAGLAAISANYGAIFDHQNNQDEQQQNSPMEENKLQRQNSYSVGSLSEQFPLVAAAAYAFRNPQSAQFHSITPSLYSPYDGSQPSDPNTPTQQFGIGTSTMIGSQQPPTYATTVSSIAAANSTPFDAFLCNWYPLFGAGSSDLIGYSTAVEHQNTNLLFHSPTVATAAQHLFTPPFDFCTTQQQLDSNSSSFLLDNSIQHQQHQLWLAEQFAEAAAISSNSSSNKSTANSASSVFVPPLSVVSKSTPPTAAVSAMPRGQPRRGGRRPREREEENLNDEDKGRRERRRERNKEAAARCRRRREERMSSLEGQVQLLQAANDEKDNLIRKLRDEQNRLLGILSKREESIVCGEPSLKFEPQKFENEQGLLTFPLNTMALQHRQNDNTRVPSGGGIGILIPQLERTKIHPQQQQHHNQCFSLTAMNNTSCQHSSSSSSSAIAADTTESTEISPSTPPPNLSSYDHRGIRNDSRGGCCSVL